MLAASEGEQILRLMHELRLLAEPDTAPPRREDAGLPPVIGIWEASRRADGIHFVRSNRYRSMWAGWSDLQEIGPKSERRRVVMIGESVAHGWLLAPAFTPAKALQQMLGEGTEVVDLCRINMTLPQAVQLNQQALGHLAADAIVHFFGNNWGVGLLPNLARAQYAGLALPDLIARRKQELAVLVQSCLDSIVLAAKAGNVPLLFVIPEFNFAEWRDVWYGPWLAGGKTHEWYAARGAAGRAFEAGELERCDALARDMLALDGGGVGGSGYDLLARCRLAQGDRLAARDLFERSWDASFLNGSIPMARCLPSNREIIQRTAAAAGAACIDLRTVFDECEGECAPLFVDYCHMSIEGTRIAMTSVARALSGPDDSLERLQLPPDSVDVANRFALALQNSALPDGVMKRHLNVLADDSPSWIPLLLELVTGCAPMWMNRKFSRLLNAELGVIPYLRDIAYASDWHVALSQNVIDVAIRVLDERGLSGRASVDAALASNHSVGNEPVDLLALRFSFLSLQKREFLWSMPEPIRNLLLPSSAFYRAYAPESAFVFVSLEPVLFSVTYRTPDAAPEERTFAVYVNGRMQGTLAATGRWRTSTISVAARDLVPGRNWVRFEWPRLADGAADALSHAADAMKRGRVPELYPVFGELHALTVRAAAP